MPCRPALRASPSQQCLWITDDVLNEAFNRFLRVSHAHNRRHGEGRRYGSSVPGPLEAHRRLSKRRIGMSAVGAGVQPGGADFGALFGFGGYGARSFDPQKDLKWSPPGYTKVKKDEHWMFPKRKRRKDDVFESFLEIKESTRDPVGESKAAFEELLARDHDLDDPEEHHLRDAIKFLQSNSNEQGARNLARLAQWLAPRTWTRDTSQPLLDLLLDKVKLRTIEDDEVAETIASILGRRHVSTSAIVRILDAVPEPESLTSICIVATTTLFKQACIGVGKFDKLPEHIENWLVCLRNCARLRGGDRSHPAWQAVYGILASHTEGPSTAARHLATLPKVVLCRVLLKYWLPHLLAEQSNDAEITTVHTKNSQLSVKRLRYRKNALDDQAAIVALFYRELQNRRYVSRRRRQIFVDPRINLLCALQKHGVRYGQWTLSLFSIAMKSRADSARTMAMLFEELCRRPQLGVPAGLAERLITYSLEGRSKANVAFAHRVFRQVPSVPLSSCLTLPVALAREGRIAAYKIWPILQRQTAEEIIPLPNREQRSKGRLSLPPAHVDLVHLMAFEFAGSKHLRPRVAYRRVWECYRFLRDRNATITSLMTRALVTAGVIRTLEEHKRPSTVQFRYILGLVRKIEGEDVADRLDNAVWRLWREDILPQRLGVYRGVTHEVRTAIGPAGDSFEQVLQARFRLRQWVRSSRLRTRKRRRLFCDTNPFSESGLIQTRSLGEPRSALTGSVGEETDTELPQLVYEGFRPAATSYMPFGISGPREELSSSDQATEYAPLGVINNAHYDPTASVAAERSSKHSRDQGFDSQLGDQQLAPSTAPAPTSGKRREGLGYNAALPTHSMKPSAVEDHLLLPSQMASSPVEQPKAVPHDLEPDKCIADELDEQQFGVGKEALDDEAAGVLSVNPLTVKTIDEDPVTSSPLSLASNDASLTQHELEPRQRQLDQEEPIISEVQPSPDIARKYNSPLVTGDANTLQSLDRSLEVLDSILTKWKEPEYVVGKAKRRVVMMVERGPATQYRLGLQQGRDHGSEIDSRMLRILEKLREAKWLVATKKKSGLLREYPDRMYYPDSRLYRKVEERAPPKD